MISSSSSLTSRPLLLCFCPFSWDAICYFRMLGLAEINLVFFVFSVLGIYILHDEFFIFRISCQFFPFIPDFVDCYLVDSMLF